MSILHNLESAEKRLGGRSSRFHWPVRGCPDCVIEIKNPA